MNKMNELLRFDLKNKRIGVLGASGFIGRNLLNSLAALDAKVVCLSRTKPTNITTNASWLTGGYNDTIILEEFLNNCDIIYHLIGSASPSLVQSDKIGDINESVIPNIKMLDACARLGNKCLIYISSGGTIYGSQNKLPINEDASTNPISAYGINKLTVEKYINMYSVEGKIKSNIIRLSNPYGPYQGQNKNQGFLGVCLKKHVEDQEIEIWGDGSTIRDYVYISDVIDALIKLGNPDYNGHILNLASGIGYTQKQIISEIENVVGQKLKVKYIPAKSHDVSANVLDTTKLKNLIKWDANTSLKDGIKHTLDWLNSGLR